jgi:hypothetical protein
VKTDAQVRQKLKQVLFRHLKRRLKEGLKQAPHTCVHNEEVELDEGGSIGICRFSEAGVPKNLVCDHQVDRGARARECPLWAPVQTKDDLKAEFQEFLDTGDRGQIAAEFPDAAALMWVLDDGENIFDMTPEQAEEMAQEMLADQSGWDWSRWPWSKKGRKE